MQVTFDHLQKTVQNSALLTPIQARILNKLIPYGVKLEKECGLNLDGVFPINCPKDLKQLVERTKILSNFAEDVEAIATQTMVLPRNIESEIHSLFFEISQAHNELLRRDYDLSYDLYSVCKQAEERWTQVNKDTYPSYEFLEQVLPKQKEDTLNHIMGLDGEQWKLFLNNLDFFRVESTIKGSKDQQSYDAYKDARALCGWLHDGLEGLISYYARPV